MDDVKSSGSRVQCKTIKYNYTSNLVLVYNPALHFCCKRQEMNTKHKYQLNWNETKYPSCPQIYILYQAKRQNE